MDNENLIDEKQKKFEKIYKIIKTILFIGLGTTILIINSLIVSNDGQYINYLVGFVVGLFAIDGLVKYFVKKKYKEYSYMLCNSIIYIILSLLLFINVNKSPVALVISCVVWSIWDIMREGEEIAEKVIHKFDAPVVAIVNLAESITVLVLSFLLLLEPTQNHVHPHVYLLGVELILEVIWPHLYHFEKLFQKKKRKQEINK